MTGKTYNRLAKNSLVWPRFVAPCLAALLLALLPWALPAQGEPPHVVMGVATVDGATPAVGTEVTAHDGAGEIGTTFTKEGGSFSLQVSRPTGVISFTVAGVVTKETLPNWASGSRTRGFKLTAYSRPAPCISSIAGPAQPAAVAEVHSHEPPHIFIGQAQLGGQPAEKDTEITAWDGNIRVGTTHSNAAGTYVIHVARSIGPISFKIAGLPAAQSFSSWSSGEITTSYNLTATRVLDCLIGTVPVGTVINAADGQINRVFTFDNASKKWLFYDPRVAEFSKLQQFTPGTPYLFLVSKSFGVYLNGKYRNLTCSGGNCWNAIVW